MAQEITSSTCEDVVLQYVSEILTGCVMGPIDGFREMANAVAHPVDNVLYPVGSLLLDSAIIAIHHMPVDDLPAIQPEMKGMYAYAVNNMNERIDQLRSEWHDIATATGPQRVEKLCRLSTAILVPGRVLKMINKVRAFHTGPVKYKPHRSSPKLAFDNLPFVATSDVTSLRGTHELLYVVQQDRTVKLCHSYIKNYTAVDHWQLAKGKPVWGAGDVIVKDGVIVKINNKSGTFAPQGAWLQQTTEQAFVKSGFAEQAIQGKWQDWTARAGVDIAWDHILDPSAAATMIPFAPVALIGIRALPPPNAKLDAQIAALVSKARAPLLQASGVTTRAQPIARRPDVAVAHAANKTTANVPKAAEPNVARFESKVLGSPRVNVGAALAERKAQVVHRELSRSCAPAAAPHIQTAAASIVRYGVTPSSVAQRSHTVHTMIGGASRRMMGFE